MGNFLTQPVQLHHLLFTALLLTAALPAIH